MRQSPTPSRSAAPGRSPDPREGGYHPAGGDVGLSALPVTYPGGGTNYANGSAQTVSATAGDNYQSGLYNNVPIVTQIANYLAAVGGVANPNALFMISSGPNNLIWLQTAPQTTIYPALSAQIGYMQTQAHTLAASVATLQADGARTISEAQYLRVGPAGHGGRAIHRDHGHRCAGSAGVQRHHLVRPGVGGGEFRACRHRGLLKYVWQNPTSFGFTAATVLAGTPACLSPAALVCNPSQLRTPDAEQTYRFADAAHLTTAGQTIEADYMYSLLTAPSEVSLLAETAVQGGLARAATVQGQIDLFEEHRSQSSINVWVSAGASSLSVKNAPNFSDTSGVPFGGSVGADYRTPVGVILGLAFAGGGQTQNFSTGGHFTQTDAAPPCMPPTRRGRCGATRWRATTCCRTVSRGRWRSAVSPTRIPATPAGRSWHWRCAAAGISTWGRSPPGRWRAWCCNRCGLMVSRRPAPAASRRCRSAPRRGIRRPVSLVARRRRHWATGSRLPRWTGTTSGRAGTVTITASLTSIAAPSYSTAAAPMAGNWATASLGVAYKLNAQVMLRGAAFAEFVNPQASSYGGGLGVNVGS